MLGFYLMASKLLMNRSFICDVGALGTKSLTLIASWVAPCILELDLERYRSSNFALVFYIIDGEQSYYYEEVLREGIITSFTD